MFRRIGLFLIVNILVMVTITTVLFLVSRIFGIDLMSWGGKTLQLFPLAIFCLIWGMGGAFISLLLSKVMAKWMMGVQIVDPANPGQYGSLVAMVHRLSAKAGLKKMPEVGVFESPEVNAFATGPSKSNSLVAVSTALLQKMDRDAVEGVVGHEIAHIANGDMVTMTLIQGIVNAFVMFFARIAAWAVGNLFRKDDEDNGIAHIVTFVATIVFEIAFSILGSMVVARFSRWREFRADKGGAAYAGRGNMIAALSTLKRLHDNPDENPLDERGTALASMKISNRPKGLAALFSTHPPLEERIERLRKYQDL